MISGAAAEDLKGKAERLAVEGLRSWIAGYATGDLSHWQDAWELHVGLLGPRQARDVIARLAQWARTLRDCSACPLQDHGCRLDRRRNECLAVAAIAACQNGDSACLELCLKALVPGHRGDAGMAPAVAYAGVMSEAGLLLEPVPLGTVERLAERPAQALLH